MKTLRSVYVTGDHVSRASVERVMRAIYVDAITGIHPPDKDTSKGKYPLGTIISGEKLLHQFYLNDEDLFHLGIFGQTGRGKTNAVIHILNNINIPWLVFDWKRTGYRNHKVFTVGRDVSPFYLNPLIPPPGVDCITWHKQFIQCISHAYFLGHGCEVILQDVTGNTLIDVLRKLQAYPAKWRKLQWLQSTERAVKALCYGGIGKVLNSHVPITHWLNSKVVFELDGLTESEAKFFVNIIMSQIYLYRKEHQHSGLRHICVIEEAHNVLQKEPFNVEAKSVMDKIFREIREYGESIIIIDQMPSTLLDSAFANTATQITLSLKHGDDVRAAGKAMLLDDDEQQLLGKLPVGTAIVKLQNRWHAPFMIRMPYVPKKDEKVTDEAIRARMRGYFQKSKVIPPGASNPRVIPVIPETDKRLLVSIHKEPLLSMTERYRKFSLTARNGNESKQKLVESGLVKEVNIRTRKARIKLLELTDKGVQKLHEIGYNASRGLRHGGVEHLYWVKQVKRKLEKGGYKVKEEYPIGNGESVDLAIVGKKIAIEIETGKSDAVGNIKKCLKAQWRVVSLYAGTQRNYKKKIFSELTKTEKQKVRAGEVYL